MKWFNTLSHNRWLEQETDRILDFGKNAAVPTGFGWLGNNGQVRSDMGTHLWITARMLHVYAVAANMGRPGAYALVEHGINALNGPLRDKQHGGWYACVNDEGVIDASKQGYQHFFVLLGAASAVTTGHPQARKLLDDAIEVIERYFWSEQEQMCLESWDEAFSKTEDYRGGNANMHAVEAFLIVYDVTHDRKWLDRALRIASVIIHDVARKGEYRVNEHFDTNWNPIRDYNIDNPAHRFRAYGGTPGHWIEWGRLMLHLRAALEARFETPPEWLLEDARTVPRHHPRRLGTRRGGRLCLLRGLGRQANRARTRALANRRGDGHGLCPLYRDRRGAVRSLVSEMVGLLHQVSDGLRKRILVAGAGHQ